MAEKENKVILEREYVVPLRRKFLTTPQYKRTPRAIRVLKQFIAKHMKVEDRDVRKVRLDKYLNSEIWFRGIRKPLPKVKVKVKKYEDGIVRVELAEIPDYLKFKIEKEKKGKEETQKKVDKIKEEKKETPEERKEEVEKEKSGMEQEIKVAEEQHKEAKHEVREKKIKNQPMQRMALQK